MNYKRENNVHIKYRKTCRVCGSSALTKVIDLGEQYIQGAFIKPGMKIPPMQKFPMSLVRCDSLKDKNACGLLQASYSVPPEILYSVYWYVSGTSNTMRNHLKEIAEESIEFIGRKTARVLDIGCNDGTLLNYYPLEYSKFGIDPASAVQKIENKDVTVIQDFFPSDRLAKKVKGVPFDIITSIAMFYDLEDPVDFVENIKKLLSSDGIWIFEVAYLPTTLKMNSYDTICHEHLEYYSLAVLEYILKKAEMKMVKATLNNINGGSVRCYATHKENFRYQNEKFEHELNKLRQQEFDLKLDTNEPYKIFQDNAIRHRDELNRLIHKLKQEGKKIHIYGASTKGNTILQFCGLDNSIIDFAAERNPDKYGAKTIGTNIPIISEEESRAKKPDYYLVLPWHFRSEFLEREKVMLERGVGIIFPFPEIEIIKK